MDGISRKLVVAVHPLQNQISQKGYNSEWDVTESSLVTLYLCRCDIPAMEGIYDTDNDNRSRGCISSGSNVSKASPSYQAYRILHFAFVVAPVIAGFDKFFHLLVSWDMYLAPGIAKLSPIGAMD